MSEEAGQGAGEPRELAVQALYEAEQRGWSAFPSDWGLSGKARRLAEGVLAQLGELDEAIEAASEHWRVDRMPVIDRVVLRLGLYELRNEPSTPSAVILSEAVRIAKDFSTERSGRFVNGVLAALARRERPQGG